MSLYDSSHLLQLAFTLLPRREFLLSRGQRLTRGAAWSAIRALAAGLHALGVRRGERVVTLLPPCPEAVYPLFLPWLLGNVNVPLNPLLREAELRHILTDCEASVVITTGRWRGQDFPALFARLQPELPALRTVIVCDAERSALYPGQLPYAAATRSGAAISCGAATSCGAAIAPGALSPDDLALLAYTSGTTGQIKGVAHTRRRMMALLPRAFGRLFWEPLRCLLTPFPPFHYAGMFSLVSALLAGGKVVLLDRFDPRAILESIERERVDHLAAAPTLYRWLLQTPAAERYDLRSLRTCTFSTEPCPPELAEGLHRRFGCRVQNIYGTTESMVIAWTGAHDSWERAATTVGRPAPGVRVRIVDEARQPLPAGATGEIAVQTSQMMTGYYRDPALTAQVLDGAGWFYTGDLGAWDSAGYLRLVDRKKDLIIRGGQNVYPAEVETCLKQLPGVRQVAVVGIPTALAGEAIWAYVEPHPGAALGASEVLAHCRERLAPFKMPAELRFVERLPVTATGKVEKYRLREWARRESEGGG